MAVLQTARLTKSFGAFQALKGVDFTVEPGEVYGFIGPNGAGKSTTIRILLGMLKATGGEARIFGKDVWREAVEIHKRLAYVPGDVHLWPNLTGGEVIDLFLKLRGVHGSGRREALIERFALDPTKKCRTYSKGNRQKVALVAAFAADAELFILDEPTSGLDPLMEHVFQQCVAEAKQAGASVLLSSHILSEVEKLCDRVGIIREGQIIETGTLAELRHLTRLRMMVQTRRPAEGLVGLAGVHELEERRGTGQGDGAGHSDDGTERNDDGAGPVGEQVGSTKEGVWRYTFQIDEEAMDAALRLLASYGIVRLESTPPTLESLFMRHYERAGGR